MMFRVGPIVCWDPSVYAHHRNKEAGTLIGIANDAVENVRVMKRDYNSVGASTHRAN